jgi:hypothetical protein
MVMQGIYYGLSIVAVFVIIFWYIKNDDSAADEPTTGLLAMKHVETSTDPPQRPDRSRKI